MGGARKSVKTKLLIDNNVEFTEHKVGEGAIYSFLLMHYAKSFSFIKGLVYEYVNHAGSQSDTDDDDPWGAVATAMKEKIMQMGLYDQYADTINAFVATAAIVSLDKMAGKYASADYRYRAKQRVQRFRKETDWQFPLDLKHMDTKARILYPFLRSGWVEPIFAASCMNRARKKLAPLPMMNRKGKNGP